MNLRNFFASVWHQRATPTQKKCATPNQKSTMSWLETYILPLYFLGHGDFCCLTFGFPGSSWFSEQNEAKTWHFFKLWWFISDPQQPSKTNHTVDGRNPAGPATHYLQCLFFHPRWCRISFINTRQPRKSWFPKGVFFSFCLFLRIDGSFSSSPMLVSCNENLQAPDDTSTTWMMFCPPRHVKLNLFFRMISLRFHISQ